jgi:hypothetical protein
MKKRGLIAALICACVLVVCGSLYVFLSLWYKDVFPAFIWIDDIYCTGKTVEEIDEELVARYPYDGIRVIDINGEELFISGEDIKMKYTFAPSLNTIMRCRGGFNWWQTLYRKKNLASEIMPNISFDETELLYRLQEWDALTSYDELYAQLVKGENGYEIESNYNYLPIMDNIYYNIKDAIYRFETEFDLTQRYKLETSGIDEYTNENYTDISEQLIYDHEDIATEFAKINELQSRDISFTLFDEKITVDAGDISDFMLANGELEAALLEEKDKNNPGSGLFIIGGQEKEISEEDSFYDNQGLIEDEIGNLIISESRIYDYAMKLADQYTTGWCMDRYRQGVTDQVLVSSGKKGDGSIIDGEVLYESIRRAFLTSEDGKASGNSAGGDVFIKGTMEYNAREMLGNTYIEVDMNKQHLYYYVDGALNMEMPVVTGNVNRGRATPTGIFNIYNKRYHTYLRGVDYVSYVNYWLGVNKGVGIHDANWRSEFGGEIYKTDGSHGCINCPEDKVSVLWEVAEVGTPVILHY